jgi:NADP-dependent 3-hydroxy acid dehydrogenase YdfG
MAPGCTQYIGGQCRAHLWLGGCACQQRGGDSQREFHHYTADDVEAQIGLNLTGPIELTRLLLPGMVQRKPGHTVKISTRSERGK